MSRGAVSKSSIFHYATMLFDFAAISPRSTPTLLLFCQCCANILPSSCAATQPQVHPDRIMVTTGSSGAFLVAFTSLFDAGARVALAAPGYPCYRNILQALGCEPVLLDAGRATRFQPTVRMLEEAERSTGRPLDGLIVASPCNPTGTILAHEELKALCEYCDQRGIRLISDEIYHGIHFGAPAMTALRFSQRPMIINSFSKYYSMTGWRVGWIVAPEADSDWSQKLSTRLESLLQNFSICAPAVSQHAALEAFACGDELEGHRRRYARNAEILMDVLPRAGFSGLCPPDGAFYLYADIGDLTDDSLSFCRRMLVETGVAATPGVDFDPIKGRRFMRFSYAGSTEDIADAAERLVRWRGGKS
eukprot:jgi/Mesvir1/18378/Mv14261-RA.2